MKIERIKEAIREIERKKKEGSVNPYVAGIEKERERRKDKVEEKQAIHINLISVAEMKAHTKEMRAENDRKFVRCLMQQGLTKLEAVKRVEVWSNEWDSVRDVY